MADTTENKTAHGWTIIDPEAPVLIRAYSFGPATANCVVFGLGDRRLLVVSPARGLPDAAYDDLAPYGDVVALVAPNAYHNMGLGPWSERFPKAARFAGAGALARLEKKAAVKGFQPLEALAPMLPAGVTIVCPPGAKFGELMVRVRCGRGDVWFLNDLVGNADLPEKGLFRFLFKVTRSGPGFKVNRLFWMIGVKGSNAALRDWLLSLVDTHPPAVLLLGHGDFLQGGDLPERLRAALHEAYPG